MPEYKLHTLQSLVFHYMQATNKDQKGKLLNYMNIIDFVNSILQSGSFFRFVCLFGWFFLHEQGSEKRKKRKEHLKHSLHESSAAPS